LSGATLRQRWPLHPKPHPYETLERYVRRIAQCYGVSYGRFCLLALGIPIGDSYARRFKKPAPEVLRRLSDGTGVSIGLLEEMDLPRIWGRLMEEMARYAATPEGRAEIERYSSKRLSQNS
jgi:hypothetical protein